MTAGYLRVLGGALLCYAALGAVLRVLPEHLAGDLGAGPVAPAARHGAAAGMFFAFFDAGVGLGGPAAGLLARLAGPAGALAGAAVAVALAAGVAARGARG